MILRHSLLILLLLICTPVLCARITLNGRVSDNSGHPLEAMITVMDAGRIVAHTMAGKSGEYSLEFTTESDSVSLRASMLGYTTLRKSIAAVSARIDLTLKGGNALKEVVVVADKITGRGDTISYNVAAFRDSSDRVIGDVIKKMPGIEVSESGRISFNGKEVKNFYVEDMDLLQGRYGIATNNVSASDVAAVQVYQNHQPIRALKDIAPSEDVTINLKLKSSAKGTWSLSAMAAGGYKPALWAAELTAMYFGRQMQNISSYKGNNSGIDVNSELRSFSDDNIPLFTDNAPLTVSSPQSPGIAPRRYIDNLSNAATLNQLIKVDTFTTINLNIGYYYDRLRKSGESLSQQYQPASGDYRSIFQEIKSAAYINSLSAAATITGNTPGSYIKNTLDVKAGWNRDIANAATSGSFTSATSSVHQHLDNPALQITDRLSFISNQGKRAWEFYLTSGWNHRPQSLAVVSDTPGSASAGSLVQNYTTDALMAHLYTSGSFMIDQVPVYTGLFANFDSENVSSELDGLHIPDIDDTLNDFFFGKLDMGVQSKLSYLLRPFYVELTLPLSYNRQWLDDRIDRSRSQGWNYALFMPHLHLTYSMGRNWLALDFYYNRMRDNSRRAARGIVMTDYLSFRRSQIERTIVDETLSAAATYRFSNPFLQLFGNASIVWNQFRHNNITGYDYDGLSTVSITLPLPNTSNSYSASVNVDKGLGFWNSTLKMGAAASLYTGSSLIGQSLFNFNTTSLSGSILANATPAPWIGAAIAFACGQSRSHTRSIDTRAPWIRSWTGRADINFYPLQNLIVNLAAENNYTNLTSGDTNVWFGDARITYRRGRFDWDLAFNNIFNRKAFTKVSYTAMDIYTGTYRLRQRNVMLTLRMKIL